MRGLDVVRRPRAGGVIGAVTLGYAFKIFMNLTLFR